MIEDRKNVTEKVIEWDAAGCSRKLPELLEPLLAARARMTEAQYQAAEVEVYAADWEPSLTISFQRSETDEEVAARHEVERQAASRREQIAADRERQERAMLLALTRKYGRPTDTAVTGVPEKPQP